MSEELQNPQLALGDIEGCIKIIDIVTKRGAFEGAELADVGAVRNRLATFLDATIQSKATEESADEVSGD